ncbi:MAG: CHAP domain-containing protein [Atopobiaceae bacterium]|nr:CHAP domain-containing protein [Atopobiaceae bacterium]
MPVLNIGWMGWAKNGELSGTTGKALRMEAVQVLVVPKGDSAPSLKGSDVAEAFRDGGSLSVQSHVQNIGWQAVVGSGVVSGTTGRSLRVESFKVNVTGANAPGGIKYCSHVQNIGWQNWVNGGSISGTTGRSLRVEAIRAELTGELASSYDLYYRVHVQDIGWLSWAKNGEAAGTAGRSARIEALQFCLVPKGGSAPSNNGAATKMHFLVGVSYSFEGLKTYVLTATSWEGAGESSALSYRFSWQRQGEEEQHVIRDWSSTRTAKLTVDDMPDQEGTYLLVIEQKDGYGNTYASSKSVYYKPSTGTCQELINAASKDIGYYVGNDPQTGSKFGRWYEAKVDKNTRNYDFGDDGVAYCVMAVSYWMDLAKVYGPGLPRAGCEGVYFAALADGRTVSATSIQPGMLILYDWDGDKLPDHIGIVEKRINSHTYQTIEGNTNNTSAGSQDNGGWVARRTRTIEDGILCGVVPYYS